jgi:hypothetical protein
MSSQFRSYLQASSGNLDTKPRFVSKEKIPEMKQNKRFDALSENSREKYRPHQNKKWSNNQNSTINQNTKENQEPIFDFPELPNSKKNEKNEKKENNLTNNVLFVDMLKKPIPIDTTKPSVSFIPNIMPEPTRIKFLVNQNTDDFLERNYYGYRPNDRYDDSEYEYDFDSDCDNYIE